MNIVFTVSNQFIPYCAVTIQSIVDSVDDGEVIHFYIIHQDAIDDDNINRLGDMINSFGENISLSFKKIDANMFAFDKLNTSQHVLGSSASFLKLMLPFIFQDFDKILYIDSDIIIKHSVREIYDTPFDNAFICGVEDIKSKVWADNLYISGKYINTGIILWNIRAINTFDYVDRVKSLLTQPIVNYCQSGDQDILNIIFHDKLKYLPVQWNIPGNAANPRTRQTLLDTVASHSTINIEMFKKGIETPYGIHFMGSQKPWDVFAHTNSYIKEWYLSAKKTGFYYTRFAKKDKGICRKCFLVLAAILSKGSSGFLYKLSGYIEKCIKIKKPFVDFSKFHIALRDKLYAIHSNYNKSKRFSLENINRIPMQTVSVLQLDRFFLREWSIRRTYCTLFNTNKIVQFKNMHVDKSQINTIHFYNNMMVVQFIEILILALLGKTDLFYIEAGWISCVVHNNRDARIPLRFRRLYSYIIDDMAFYFDAFVPSRIGAYLNSPEAKLSQDKVDFCKKMISKITGHFLTKYNHQPICNLPIILTTHRKRILVMDQVSGDASVTRSHASEKTFQKMLDAAISENPDADIIIKTHPDLNANNRKGYYGHVKAHDNIYILSENINPILLINSVDKVYVCSSQSGFEALLCGKPVVVFGTPIYGGWGLTDDRMPYRDRQQKLSLEEVFYAIYIEFTFYINPKTGERIFIDDFLDEMIAMRNEYLDLVSNK